MGKNILAKRIIALILAVCLLGLSNLMMFVQAETQQVEEPAGSGEVVTTGNDDGTTGSTEPTTTESDEPTTTDPSEPTTTDPSEPTTTESDEPTTTDPSEPTTTDPSEIPNPEVPLGGVALVEDETLQAEIYADGSYTDLLETDVRIEVSGTLPAGGVVKAYPVELVYDFGEEEEILFAYDITIYDDEGNLWQPAPDSPVNVAFRSSLLEGYDEVNVYHAEEFEAAPVDEPAIEPEIEIEGEVVDETSNEPQTKDMAAIKNELAMAMAAVVEQFETNTEIQTEIATPVLDLVETVSVEENVAVFVAEHFSTYVITAPAGSGSTLTVSYVVNGTTRSVAIPRNGTATAPLPKDSDAKVQLRVGPTTAATLGNYTASIRPKGGSWSEITGASTSGTGSNTYKNFPEQSVVDGDAIRITYRSGATTYTYTLNFAVPTLVSDTGESLATLHVNLFNITQNSYNTASRGGSAPWNTVFGFYGVGTYDSGLRDGGIGENSGARNKGVLQSTLGGDGFPQIKSGYRWANVFAGGTISGRTVYNTTFEFFYDQEFGYYTYDGKKNHAQYNSGSGVQLYTDPLSYAGFNSYGGFWPFDNVNNATQFVNAGVASTYDPITKTNSSNPSLYLVPDTTHDFHFGMSLTVPFRYPENGLVTSKDDGSTAPMIFEFTGDDDLWVFIDGKLVLDLGGTHGALSGTIDFSTGAVKVQPGTWNAYNDLVQVGHLWNASFSGNESFVSADFNTKFSSHEMKIFYLERGASQSNLKLRFNTAEVPEYDLSVSKETANINNDVARNTNYYFQLFTGTSADSCNNLYTGEYQVSGGTLINPVVKNTFDNADGYIVIAGDQTASIQGVESGIFYKFVEVVADESTRLIIEKTEWKNNGTIAAPGSSTYVSTTDSSNGIYRSSRGVELTQNAASKQMIFCNTYKEVDPNPQTLKLQKLTGEGVSTSLDFDFTIYLAHPNEDLVLYRGPAVKYDANGQNPTNINISNGRVQLKSGESVVISGLPVGTTFEIREDDKGAEYDPPVITTANIPQGGHPTGDIINLPAADADREDKFIMSGTLGGHQVDGAATYTLSHTIIYTNNLYVPTADLTITKAFKIENESVSLDQMPDGFAATFNVYAAAQGVGGTWVKSGAALYSIPYTDFTNGSYTIPDLPVGNYIVEEEISGAPSGVVYVGTEFNSLVVNADGNWAVYNLGRDGVEAVVTNCYQYLFEFPETGGIGTVMFTVIGLAIMGGAGMMMILYFRKGSRSK